MPTSLETAIARHLSVLAEQIGPRPTGSAGNQRAGAYLRDQFAGYGWSVETPTFHCKTWAEGAARLTCRDEPLAVQPNPFSPPFVGRAPFIVCRDLAALQAVPLSGRLVVLTGKLAAYPYMPKHYPYVTFEDQQQVIRWLEDTRPAAVIGIGVSPLFCDADFMIPSVTVHPRDEARLVGCPDAELNLTIEGQTLLSTGHNVIAKAGTGSKRIIVCAHYDTWFGTPGALDNAAGVCMLLGLAEVLRDRLADLPQRVEIVAFNGEDHYAAPGEGIYLQQDLSDVTLVINIDAVGAAQRSNGICHFTDDAALLEQIRGVQRAFPNLVEVEPWIQGDHSVFVQRGIPAVALSSTDLAPYSVEVFHTPADTVDRVDVSQVAEAVAFVARLVGA